MAHPFPSESWLAAFEEVLNRDERYAKVAANWEGDIMFIIEPDEGSSEPALQYFMDLWHGECRKAYTVPLEEKEPPKPKFTLRATRSQFIDVLKGEIDPMQASGYSLPPAGYVHRRVDDCRDAKVAYELLLEIVRYG